MCIHKGVDYTSVRSLASCGALATTYRLLKQVVSALSLLLRPVKRSGTATDDFSGSYVKNQAMWSPQVLAERSHNQIGAKTSIHCDSDLGCVFEQHSCREILAELQYLNECSQSRLRRR